MTVKTDFSRFDIHDELTAPAGSDRILKTISDAGGAVSKLVGALAGSPAALKAYARMRSELRRGKLPAKSSIRIGLAVAERHGDDYSIAQHARAARLAGIGLDEISLARSFESGEEKEAALLTFVKGVLEADGPAPAYLLEEAREAGWSDEQILEALGQVSLHQFQSLVANAAELPNDQIDSVVMSPA
jgi:alkylhydroperoxidase family enzyme